MRKHKLLIEDILPAMASNRKVQRLLNEFMDLVSEYEIADANHDHRNPVLPPKTSAPVTNQIESCSLATGVKDTAPPKLDKKHPEGAATDSSKNNAQVAKTPTSFTPALANEASADNALVTDQVVQDTPDQEGGS